MSRNTLNILSKAQKRLLCEVLWSWSFCENCNNNGRCDSKICPGQRINRLGPFFNRYKALVTDFETLSYSKPCGPVRTHEDIAAMLKLIKSHPEVPRSALPQLITQAIPSRSPSPEDVDNAMNLAANIMVMINCSGGLVTPGVLEQGLDWIRWHDTMSFSDLVDEAFQATDDPVFGIKVQDAPINFPIQLTARKLKKRVGITFIPTSDIRSHLRYDPKANVVEIFHHTTLLKEHLRLTKDKTDVVTTADALRLGALPRQIALEIIDSIQQLLFPLTDAKSFSMLRGLVSKHSMDSDCLRFESVAIRSDDEISVPYMYFGSRLADLFEELHNPRPRGYLEKWLERKSGARYIMLATLMGVMFAILLGVASIIVSSYQAYVGYEAWKHPVAST